MRKVPVPDGARLYVAASMPAAIGTGTASNASSAVVSVANVLAANALVLLGLDRVGFIELLVQRLRSFG